MAVSLMELSWSLDAAEATFCWEAGWSSISLMVDLSRTTQAGLAGT